MATSSGNRRITLNGASGYNSCMNKTDTELPDDNEPRGNDSSAKTSKRRPVILFVLIVAWIV